MPVSRQESDSGPTTTPTKQISHFEHDLYRWGDPDAPSSIKDGNGDIVLALCRRCGRGEAELEEPCNILSKDLRAAIAEVVRGTQIQPSSFSVVTRYDLHDLESSNRQLAESVEALHDEIGEKNELMRQLVNAVNDLEKVIEKLPETLAGVVKECVDASNK
jgi:methyl-accepting chemotaxis protein